MLEFDRITQDPQMMGGKAGNSHIEVFVDDIKHSRSVNPPAYAHT